MVIATPSTSEIAGLETEADIDRAIRAAEAADRLLVTEDFFLFLDYVFILEPAQPLAGIKGGKYPFQKWDYIMDLARSLQTHRLILLLKARQLGFSWLISAYVIWLLLFHEGSKILMISKGQLDSQALLRKAKFIYKNLPESWQIPIDKNSGSEFSLEGSESEILALPSTEEAGRGFTATIVFQDEADFHPEIKENMQAIKPTIDGGGQLIMGTTVNKKDNQSTFKSLYRGAPDNGWQKIFWTWENRPSRDSEWYERVKREAKDLPNAMELGIDLYMEQEYPESEQQALKPANALAAFDLENLERMKAYCVPEPKRTIEGLINIYREFEWGRAYAAGTDPADGVGRDDSVTVVMDRDSGFVVADIKGNKIKPPEFTALSLILMNEYHNPRWAIESNNTAGGVVTTRAILAKYKNFFKSTTQGGIRKIGWHTNKNSRAAVWTDLIEATDAGRSTIPNLAGLNQFETVIKHPDNDYKPEAQGGEHDDYPMAVGLALQASSQSKRKLSGADEPEHGRTKRSRRRRASTSHHRRF